MKAFFKASILVFSFAGCLAGQTEEIRMLAEYSSKNSEMADLLTFERIDFFKIKIGGPDLSGKGFALTAKEIWNGEIKKAIPLVNSEKQGEAVKLSSDTLDFKVLAKKTSDNKLRVHFGFPRFGFDREFEATASDDYSLRAVGTTASIDPNEPFYILAYILPYEKDGWKMYCEVENSGKDIENWGKEFGITHYMLFEMKFE